MKTKLEMAHEWYMMQTRRNGCALVADAWKYADAMQAEADKREKEEIEKRSVELRNILNLSNFKPLECQEEWQPDWSQAPDVATHWTMRQDGKCLWWKGKPLFDGSCFYDAVGICRTVGYAPSFGYTGDWCESLRKRPQ